MNTSPSSDAMFAGVGDRLLQIRLGSGCMSCERGRRGPLTPGGSGSGWLAHGPACLVVPSRRVLTVGWRVLPRAATRRSLQGRPRRRRRAGSTARLPCRRRLAAVSAGARMGWKDRQRWRRRRPDVLGPKERSVGGHEAIHAAGVVRRTRKVEGRRTRPTRDQPLVRMLETRPHSLPSFRPRRRRMGKRRSRRCCRIHQK